MPEVKNKNAAEFCEKLNAAGISPITLEILEALNSPFTENEIRALNRAGFEVIGATATKNPDTRATKCKIRDFAVFLLTGAIGELTTAHWSLKQFTMPEHVAEFVKAITGPDASRLWSDAKLMYRGQNLFKIYTSKDFNDQVERIIKNESDLLVREECEECVRRFEEATHGEKRERYASAIESLRNWRDENKITPDEITCQEVYLGYVPSQDSFFTAWDVWGSDNTGSVVISFRIAEDGSIYSNDPYEHGRKLESIDDGCDKKFYEKPASRKSFYEMVSGSGREDWDLIDIRLD